MPRWCRRSDASGPYFRIVLSAHSTLRGLRTAVAYVPDLAAARDWYADTFALAPYFDEPYYVGFAIGGFELGLMPEGEGHTAGLAGTYVYWGVADVQAAVGHAVSCGATVHQAPGDVGGGITVGVVLDPWGNAVGFIHNPHFDPAQVR